MRHVIKAGENLSSIARAHGMTLAQLLDANPGFRSNPNSIRVGDVLTIPVGGIAHPDPHQSQPDPGRMLGKLSEQFETGGRGPGTVSTGAGDAGGVSYGSYQMTSRPRGGTVARFVTQHDFPFRDRFATLTPGSAEFSAAWRELARRHPKEFQASQHEFIKRTHFDHLVRKVLQQDGLNVLTRSHAVQEVIWSTAVQHGGGSDIPHRALAAANTSADDPHFDRRFIVAIYAERGRTNSRGELVHFVSNSPAVQRGVAARFREEERRALAMLAELQGV